LHLLKKVYLSKIETDRITKTSVLFDYLNALDLGLEKDIREKIYNNVSSMTFDAVKNFQEEHVKGNNYTILILGDKDKLDINSIEKYGEVKFLTLEEVFGY